MTTITITPNLVAIYYSWYDPNFKECLPADQGNVDDCNSLGKGSEVYGCPDPNDHTTLFPLRWAGRYLPNLGGAEDGLYSSTNPYVIRKQLSLMKQAGIGVLAFSFWGQQKPITIQALDVLFNVLNSKSNPHPEIKISIYYEDSSNRNIDTIKSDINSIIDKYGNSPFFYKINNKPVFWAYTNSTLSVAQKWSTIRTDTGIYCIQKEFSGWQSNLNLTDSLHEYAPAVRVVTTQFNNIVYAIGISAGFWRYHACSRLDRCDVINDYSSFENGLIQAKNSNPPAQHIIVFWNEWQENSGIEPASLYNHIEGSSSNPFTQINPSYGNKYIDLVAKYFYNPIIDDKKPQESGLVFTVLLLGLGLGAGYLYIKNKNKNKEKSIQSKIK